MPNPWTGKGNPYTRKEVIERLHQTLREGKAIIAAGAGTGISAKFIEQGGGDLIIIYNSGRFRMAGHGSTSGLMSYGDANAVAMEIGEFEVLPVVEETPVICGVHATDPRRRMWHWLLKVKEMDLCDFAVQRWVLKDELAALVYNASGEVFAHNSTTSKKQLGSRLVGLTRTPGSPGANWLEGLLARQWEPYVQ